LARMSRAERQDQTRELLLEAAERVFTRQGFHATSVDQIAEEAGFSKGAVYSNFDGKDELFLGVLERRWDSRAIGVERGIDANKPVTDQARDAGDAFINMLHGNSDWSLLLLEYAAHAARHPEVRDRFAARNRQVRAEMATLIDTHLSALGLISPIPTDRLATILHSLGSGIILEQLTDPDGVDDDTFGAALGLMFAGLVASTPVVN
jgi:AcrR family transcriptional regulator